MLTKDLLQFSHRKGRIYPTFVEERQASLVKLAGDLVSVYSQSVGKTLTDIEAAADTVETRESCADGLKKLLMDRCRFQDLDDAVVEQRWQIFRVAQELRDEGGWGDPAEFARILSERCEAPSDVLRSKLFSDHPDERRCEAFETVDSQTLLSEYNRAQLQTLFIFADDVKITIKGASIAEKRAFFRQLKFHSLMSEVEVNPDSASLTVSLSGPLKLFQKSTTYGLRLARFVLNVLHLKDWEIEATIHLKNKHLDLKLDPECGVKPRPGRGLTGYVPEEFTDVMRVFNDGDHGWKLSASEDFVAIGKQSYCFPDFDLKKGSKMFHVELFHSWHKGQIVGRIAALSGSKVKNLIIGIDKALVKDKDIQKALQNNTWFEKYGFEFSQFPTPRQLLKVVQD